MPQRTTLRYAHPRSGWIILAEALRPQRPCDTYVPCTHHCSRRHLLIRRVPVLIARKVNKASYVYSSLIRESLYSLLVRFCSSYPLTNSSYLGPAYAELPVRAVPTPRQSQNLSANLVGRTRSPTHVAICASRTPRTPRGAVVFAGDGASGLHVAFYGSGLIDWAGARVTVRGLYSSRAQVG